MPTKPPQKDLVIEARELLAKAPEPLEQALRLGVGGILRNSTVLHKKVAEVYTNEHFNLFIRAPELLCQLCDEVERLRKSNKSMADELGHQDSYWDDPLRGNFKC